MTHSDEQAELWALGALIEYDAAALLAAHPLTPEDFTSPERSLAFRAVESLVAEGRPVALEAVLLRLRIGGGPRAAELMRAAAGVVDAKGWGAERFGVVAGELFRLRTCRALEAHLRERLEALGKPGADPLAVSAAAQEFVAGLGAAAVEVDRTGADDLLEVLDDWEHADERPQCVPTGIPMLDVGDERTFHGIGGWKYNLNILAGRPGSMKSGLATSAAWNQLQAGLTVGFIGLEEGTKFIQRRLLAQRLNVRVGTIATTRLHEYQEHGLARAAEELHAPMQRLLVSSAATNPQVLERTVRRWVLKGARVVYVDHMAEIDHALSVRDRLDLAFRATMLRLRRLAIPDTRRGWPGCALVLLAHLNRDAGDGRPKKEHLKESGYLEDMGRLILGMWDDQRWPERALCDVLKGNEVEKGVTVWLPKLREAALVDSVGGGILDWQEVESERRERQRGAAGGWRSRSAGGNGVGQD